MDPTFAHQVADDAAGNATVQKSVQLRRTCRSSGRPIADAARTIFYIAAISMAIFGVGLLLFPQVMFTLSDDPGVPANPGWVRWAGGLLLGMAVATWLAANNPESQRPLAVGLATAFTLIALALLYSNLVGDYRGAIVELAADRGQRSLAAAMWWLSSKSIAKERGEAVVETAGRTLKRPQDEPPGAVSFC
jgi:hypothetical protein